MAITNAPTRSLTVFLIKDDVTRPRDILTNRHPLERHRVRLSGAGRPTLYVRQADTHEPRWTSFFAGALDPPLHLDAQSTSAVLLLTRAKRTFALTFGYGRHLLRPGVYEEDFGLKTTLNAIDPGQVRSIDRETIEADTRQTREQAARPTDITGFGLDIEYDLLQAATGTPRDHNLGTQLAGRDSLNAKVNTTIDALPTLLDAYLEHFQSKAYQQTFPWVDHIRPIRDAERVAALTHDLLNRLTHGKTEGIWLAVPQVIDWEHIEGLRYGTSQREKLHTDLHLNDYLSYRPANELTLAVLKRDVIQAIGTNDEIVHQWTAHRCLYAELSTATTTTLLAHGLWYEIERDYVTTINNAVGAIPTSTLSFPPFQDKHERAYNERVATLLPSLTCLDGQHVLYAGHPNKIEFCDLYGNQRFIHVKHYHGSSSVLSHLFNQGYVSASAFLRDATFRTTANNLLPQDAQLARPDQPITPAAFEVVFGIISRSATKDRLPFFSKVTLRRVTDDLRAYGYNVSVADIRDQQQTTHPPKTTQP